MGQIEIDEGLCQAISLLIQGAMTTGNPKLLPAINRATAFLEAVVKPKEEKPKPAKKK